MIAAERLFLSSGYDDVSVRAICAAADANPAAVHYHFGSKEDLVAALLESRLAPLRADTLGGGDLAGRTIADFIDLVVDPLVRLRADPIGHLHLQLLTRFVDAHPDAAWTRRWFRLDDWVDLLTPLVPGLDTRAARRRWALAFTLILHRFGGSGPLSDEAIAALRAFVAAGLGAPALPKELS